MPSTLRLLCVPACFALAAVASAEVARFAFDAVVTFVDAPVDHPVNGRLVAGDTVSGTLQYDLGLADELDSVASVGSYEALPAGHNRSRATGGNGFMFDSSFIPRPFFVATVDDGPQFDTLLVNMSGDTSPSTLQRDDTRFVEMGLLLESANTGLFGSDALPQELSLDGFELAGLDFFGTGTAFPTFLVHTTITALTTMPPLLPGDYNDNGTIEQGDLDLVLLEWGKDANHASSSWTGLPPVGIIDQQELDSVLLNWGSFAASAVSVPEPSTFLGTIAACLPVAAFLRTRRGRNSAHRW